MKAVSYTHLDVYKRQVVSGGEITAQGAKADILPELLTDSSAVSYTHLDVYKRQVIDLFARGGNAV